MVYKKYTYYFVHAVHVYTNTICFIGFAIGLIKEKQREI
jgi:hypothetical protein